MIEMFCFLQMKAEIQAYPCIFRFTYICKSNIWEQRNLDIFNCFTDMYCRVNLTPKLGPVYLIQNCLQNSRKVIFQYIDRPKIKFYTIFTYTN